MAQLQLEHFLAAYELRSFGKAAHHLGISQPALSKSIKKLEGELGVDLFERHPGGVQPTLYGECLARRGYAIRADLESAVEEIQQLREGDGGEVRLGAAPALSPHFLPRVIAAAQELQPRLRFVVREGLYDMLAHEVAQGRLDFALTNLPANGIAEALQAEELFRDRFVVCGSRSHPLAQARKVHAEELVAYPWITPPREGPVWRRLTEVCVAAGIAPPRPVLETDAASLIKALLGKGNYVSCVPRQFLLDELTRGEVVEINVPDMRLERTVALVSRKGRVHPASTNLALHACRSVAGAGRDDESWASRSGA